MAIGLAVLLIAGGCGSDSSATGAQSDDEVTVTTGSLSKADFIKQAGDICLATDADYTRAVTRFTTKVKPGNSAKEEAALLQELVDTTFVPTYRKMNEEISSLGAPSGDEAEVTAFVVSMEQVLDAAEENSKSFDYLNPFEKPIKLASAYGLTGCANSLN